MFRLSMARREDGSLTKIQVIGFPIGSIEQLELGRGHVLHHLANDHLLLAHRVFRNELVRLDSKRVSRLALFGQTGNDGKEIQGSWVWMAGLDGRDLVLKWTGFHKHLHPSPDSGQVDVRLNVEHRHPLQVHLSAREGVLVDVQKVTRVIGGGIIEQSTNVR